MILFGMIGYVLIQFAIGIWVSPPRARSMTRGFREPSSIRWRTAPP
jgi:hypothetical protein